MKLFNFYTKMLYKNEYLGNQTTLQNRESECRIPV